MGSRLVNVRLDEARLRKAQALRERGIALSDVVREAIDERFATMNASARPAGVRAALGEILRTYPDPPGVPERGYDVHDAREARAAVAAQLRRRRR